MEENEIIKHLIREIKNKNFEALFILSDAFEELGNKVCFAYRALYKLYKYDFNPENFLAIHNNFSLVREEIKKELSINISILEAIYYYYSININDNIFCFCIKNKDDGKIDLLDVYSYKTGSQTGYHLMKNYYNIGSIAPSGLYSSALGFMPHT